MRGLPCRVRVCSWAKLAMWPGTELRLFLYKCREVREVMSPRGLLGIALSALRERSHSSKLTIPPISLGRVVI